MGAVGLRGLETAEVLEAAAGAGFETDQRLVDAVLDGGVVADVEVQVAVVLEGAPVAAVEGIGAADVEGAGDDPAVALGHDGAEERVGALQQLVEEAAVQVLVAVVEAVDVMLVQLEQGALDVRGDLVVGQRADAGCPVCPAPAAPA